MAQQLGFFEARTRTLVRTPRGTIEYHPQAFDPAECGSFFRDLMDAVAWSSEKMRMYDKLVDVPRLTAWYRDPDPLPETLELIRGRVGMRLGVRFNAVSLNYYRDGADSVAWHSDHDEDLIADPIVALVSLGAVREMQLRPKLPPRHLLRCDLEPGSILAMCGDVQHVWEHHIPKVRKPTDARISVALRTKIEGTRTADP
ncbi:MAG: alpha-ketoglutarate-dependent dioxygenase AlkB [Vulcanimicrobiaceae bacterium]